MIYTFHEEVYIEQHVDPQLLDAASAAQVWEDAGDYERVVFLLSVGATDTTVDFKLQQATDSSGTSAKDITGAAITQVTAAEDNTQYVIELETRKMDINNDFNFVSALVTAGDGATGAQVSLVFMGINPERVAVTQHTDVDETVFVGG